MLYWIFDIIGAIFSAPTGLVIGVVIAAVIVYGLIKLFN